MTAATATPGTTRLTGRGPVLRTSRRRSHAGARSHDESGSRIVGVHRGREEPGLDRVAAPPLPELRGGAVQTPVVEEQHVARLEFGLPYGDTRQRPRNRPARHGPVED